MTTGKALLPLTLFISLASAFSFVHNEPTQCDPFTLSWTGGTAPFSLLITPVFDNPRNFSIPESASGSFSVQLPLNAGQQFVATMSDATGFASGGVTGVLAVGNSVSGASCDTQIPPTAFQFQLNSQLLQCQPYTISGFDGATQPVTITGLIPLGKAMQLHPNPGPSSFVWDAVNVPAGTSILFFLTDAAGRFGGSSHINQVGSSAISTCINDQSPKSTADSTSGTPTPTSSGSGQTPSPSSTNSAPSATTTASHSSHISPGTIAGTVVGILIALLVVGTLVAFWFKQYRNRRGSRTGGAPRRTPPPADLFPPNSGNPLNQASPFQYGSPATPWTTFTQTPGVDYIAEPWALQPTPSGPYSSTLGAPYSSTPGAPYPTPGAPYSLNAPYSQNALYSQNSPYSPNASYSYNAPSLTPTAPYPTQSAQSSTRSPYSPTPSGPYASSAGATEDGRSESPPQRSAKSPPPGQRPTRLVLHTDAEEEIELPPQYSDRRAPPS